MIKTLKAANHKKWISWISIRCNPNMSSDAVHHTDRHMMCDVHFKLHTLHFTLQTSHFTLQTALS